MNYRDQQRILAFFLACFLVAQPLHAQLPRPGAVTKLPPPAEALAEAERLFRGAGQLAGTPQSRPFAGSDQLAALRTRNLDTIDQNLKAIDDLLVTKNKEGIHWTSRQSRVATAVENSLVNDAEEGLFPLADMVLGLTKTEFAASRQELAEQQAALLNAPLDGSGVIQSAITRTQKRVALAEQRIQNVLQLAKEFSTATQKVVLARKSFIANSLDEKIQEAYTAAKSDLNNVKEQLQTIRHELEEPTDSSSADAETPAPPMPDTSAPSQDPVPTPAAPRPEAPTPVTEPVIE